MSETHLTNDIQDFEINCDNYEIIRCDSHSKHTGGVLIYIRKDIRYKLVCNKNCDNNMWVLTIKVNYKKLLCGSFSVVYRSPSKSVCDFVRYFEDWCDDYLDITDINTICGDFNINFKEDSFYKNKIVNVFSDNSLKQFVTVPTRITENSQTIIDYVLCNSDLEIMVVNDDMVADHATIYFGKIIDECGNKNKIKYVSKIMNYSDEKFIEKLSKYNWNVTSNDVNDQANFLDRALKESINSFCKTIKVKDQDSMKWYSKELLKMKNERDIAHSRAICYNYVSENWNIYKRKRNRYVCELRTAEKNYVNNQLIDASGDNRKTWKLLKKMLNGEKFSDIKIIDEKGENVVDVANTFKYVFY